MVAVDQWGPRNPGWRGDEAGYGAMHDRVVRRRGKPMRCERCGTEDPTKRYEWANLTGRYEDPEDYERMCKRCHQRYDIARREPKPIRHGTPGGCWAHRKQGTRPCDPCRLAFNEYARARYVERKKNLAKAGEFDLPEPTVGGSRAGLPDHALSVTPRRPGGGS